MIKINRETKWKVGDTFLSGDDVYMICHRNKSYFLLDLESGTGSLHSYDTLEELIENYIEYDDIKIDLECDLHAGGMSHEI